MKSKLHQILIFFILISLSSSCAAQKFSSANWESRTVKAIDDLIEFVAIPNDALNHKDILANIDWIEKQFTNRGFTSEILETSNEPLLLLDYSVGPKQPTVLFYMHLDGQAVDVRKWDQPDPYAIVVKEKRDDKWVSTGSLINNQNYNRELRLFGRSAADDKAPIIAFLHAFDMLIEKGQKPAFNLKVVLDGEEEKGSKPLPAAVKKYKDKFAADALIINDGPKHITNQPTLIYGCRGNMRVDLTVYGPALPQHSGHFGNYAPNPAFRLSQLLATMKDESGRVIIPGYYDGIAIDANIKKRLAAVPDNEDAIHDLLQIYEPEKVGNNYQESLQYPSLNVRGLSSAWVGAQARTIVPANAVAAIDIRLVPESDPHRLITLIKDHITNQGYQIVKEEPEKEVRKNHARIARVSYSEATLPFRTDMDDPVGKWLADALRDQFDQDPIEVRIMGGTVPISAFVRELQIPAVIVPLVNADNNQHSPNENMRVGNIEDGIKTFYGVFTSPLKTKS